MAEYIEREATLAYLRGVYCADCKGGTKKTICRICDINDVIDSAANVPAADVAPVVLCKDCKYAARAKWNKKGYRICPASGMEITDDDFCSYGERNGA